MFPSASRCLYRANALPVSVGVCGTALEYLLSSENMAFSLLGVFFPFPFLQPVVSPRNLPAWTSLASATQGPWRTVAGERFIYVDTYILFLYIPYEEILRVTQGKELSWGIPAVTPVRRSCLFALRIPSEKAGGGGGCLTKSSLPSVHHHSIWQTGPPLRRSRQPPWAKGVWHWIKRNKTQLRMTPSPPSTPLARRC